MSDGLADAMNALLSDPDSARELIGDAEIQTVTHPDDPAVNYFLAHAYHGLSEELPLEFRREVEHEKLRRKGMEHVLNLPCTVEDGVERLDVRKMIADMGPNPPAVNVQAANDYGAWHNSNGYMHGGNAFRAGYNLLTAVHKSVGRPEFERTKYALLYTFALDERLVGKIEVIDQKFYNMLCGMGELLYQNPELFSGGKPSP